MSVIFEIYLGPMSSYRWVASPEEEIIDTINKRRLIEVSADGSETGVVRITREANLSIKIGPGVRPLWVNLHDFGIWNGEEHSYPVMVDPEFDLDEIELGNKLVAQVDQDHNSSTLPAQSEPHLETR